MRRVVAGAATALATLAAAPADASFPGRNGPIVYSKGGDLVAVSPRGRVHHITHDRQNESHPAVSPDGRSLVFRYNDTDGEIFDQIFTSDMDGRHRRAVTGPNTHRRYLQPTWSPDGSHLAFVESTFTDVRLWVTDREGRDRRSLVRCFHCYMNDVDWGVGGEIVFIRNGRLWLVNAHGKPRPRELRVKRLAGDPEGRPTYYDPSWSPSGRTIAFTTGEPTSYRSIDLVNADGRNRRRLITHRDYYTDPTDYANPVWSPDGKRIAFNRFRSPPPDGKLVRPNGICTIRPDGSGRRLLTTAVRNPDAQLHWAPKALAPRRPSG